MKNALKIKLLSGFTLLSSQFVFAQGSITTTGNNVADPTNPYVADIVIGSYAQGSGTRHDGSIMFWSNNSASRLLNVSDVFYLSVWNTLNSNIALSAALGGSSYFLGNVGIGTTAPSEKLSVNGKIRAHEIKVETANWPDYVFDEDYKILGLQELDAYIKANKHLPDMPSSKEAEANGVKLGEMNKLLLKKVEELTLHLIEKDKQLIEEQKINHQQQERLKLIEQKLRIK